MGGAMYTQAVVVFIPLPILKVLSPSWSMRGSALTLFYLPQFSHLHALVAARGPPGVSVVFRRVSVLVSCFLASDRL